MKKNLSKLLLVLAIGFTFLQSCSKDDSPATPVIPTINTTTATSITTISATSGGTIISDGGAEITARGVVWSTLANPTITLSTKTTDGIGSGSFSSAMTGLNATTIYYVRAYATNSSGTGYGTEKSFTTATPVIPTITIGTQTWMTNNLDVTTYRNGNPIPQVQDPTAWENLTKGAWCYYENNTANGTEYGKLYNWYAVNDLRGLAPTGYHVPSDAEWTTLTTFLGGESIAGGKMKATTLWVAPNTDATNSSGFTGLPGGTRYTNGPFGNVGNYGYWWSSTETGTTGAWTRTLGHYSGNVARNGSDKRNGFSVRCLRD